MHNNVTLLNSRSNSDADPFFHLSSISSTGEELNIYFLLESSLTFAKAYPNLDTSEVSDLLSHQEIAQLATKSRGPPSLRGREQGKKVPS